jgi:hypothetical protein
MRASADTLAYGGDKKIESAEVYLSYHCCGINKGRKTQASINMPPKKPTPPTRTAKPPRKTQSGKSSKTVIDTIIHILYCKAIEGIDDDTSILLFHDLIIPMAKPEYFDSKDVKKGEYFDPIPTYHAPINHWLEHIHEMCFKAITTNKDIAEVTLVMSQVQKPILCPHLVDYISYDHLIESLFHGSALCTQEQKETIIRGYIYAVKGIISLMFTYVMISGHKGMPSATTGYLTRMCATGMFPQKLVDIAREVVSEMADSRELTKSKPKAKPREPSALAAPSAAAAEPEPEPEHVAQQDDNDELTEDEKEYDNEEEA